MESYRSISSSAFPSLWVVQFSTRAGNENSRVSGVYVADGFIYQLALDKSDD